MLNQQKASFRVVGSVACAAVMMVASVPAWAATASQQAALDAKAQAGSVQTVASMPDEASAKRQAAKQKSPVGVDGLTSSYQTVSANPNGTFTAQISSTPTRVQDKAGAWSTIDTSLVRHGSVWAPRRAGNPVTVSNDPGTGSVVATATVAKDHLPAIAAGYRDATAAAAVPVGLPGARAAQSSDPMVSLIAERNVPAAKVAGNAAGFVWDPAHRVTVRVQAGGQTFSPIATLPASGSGAVTVRYRYRLRGVRAHATKRGPLVLTTSSGLVVTSIGSATLSTTDGAREGSVPFSVKPTSEGMIVSVTVPKQFMTAARGRTIQVGTGEIFAPSTSTYTWAAAAGTRHDTSAEYLVGHHTGTNTTGRAYMAFNVSKYMNKAISSAGLKLWQFAAAQCSGAPAQMNVGAVNKAWGADLTWTKQQSDGLSLLAAGKIGVTNSKGGSGCAAGWLEYGVPDIVDVTGIVRHWVNAPTTANHGFGFFANTEATNSGARKIRSSRSSTNPPVMWITYFERPNAPSNLRVADGVNDPAVGVTTANRHPVFHMVTTAPDGGALSARWDLVRDSDKKHMWTVAPAYYVISGSSWDMLYPWPPHEPLTDGKYTLSAWGNRDGLDSASATVLHFTVDTTPPTAPTVTATNFHNGQWAHTAPSSNTFTFSAAGARTYRYSADGAPEKESTGTLSWKESVGWHTLSVRAVDYAGNVSEPTVFSFGVGTAAFTGTSIETRSAGMFPLAAQTAGHATGAVIKWRQTGDDGDFHAIDPAALTVGGQTWDGSIASLDAGVGSALPTGLAWNAEYPAPSGGTSPTAPMSIDLQVCFTMSTGSPLCNDDQSTGLQYVEHGFGGNFATADVGVGQVALATGELSVSATDSSVPGTDLSAGRNWLSEHAPADGTGLFGPGWQADVPSSQAGAGDATVVDQSSMGTIMLTYPTGETDVYDLDSTQSGVKHYSGSGQTEDDGSFLLLKDNDRTLIYQDADGTKTYWTKVDDTWVVHATVELQQQGKSAVQKTDTEITAVAGKYATDGGDAAWCANLTDPDKWATTRGCRVQIMHIAASNTTKPTGDDVGDYPGRVSSIEEVLFNPDTQIKAMQPRIVSQYAYDANGYLRQQWDPRLGTGDARLLTSYDYEVTNNQLRLTHLTPASKQTGDTQALKPFALSYDDAGHLTRVRREDPHGDNADTAIVYAAPISGGGVADLRGEATTTWGQTAEHAPVTAVAVFSPDPQHHWDGSPSEPTAGDWAYADFSYLDLTGSTTNTATYGAGGWQIGTTIYDANGRVTSTLSAGNRARALAPTTGEGVVCQAPAAVCANPDSAGRAAMLSTQTAYSSDPDLAGVVTDTVGPAFDATIQGAIRTVRTRTHADYNEGAPTGDAYTGMALSTTTTVAADLLDTRVRGVDTKITRTGYDGQGDLGWRLRQATSSTTAMSSGSDITTRTTYNEDGSVATTSQPGSNGHDAGTTINRYYRTEDSSGCPDTVVHPEWDGLLCASGPAAAPSSGPPMPSSQVVAYTADLQTAVTMDRSGTAVRTTSTSYDDAGRVTTVETSGGTSGNKAIPATTTTYSPDTGAVTTVESGGKSVNTGYDSWGRTVSTTDADGVTATSTYDIASQVTSSNDGKGSVDYTYGNDREHRGVMTAMSIHGLGDAPGDMSVSYDPDGQAAVVENPNGVKTLTASNPVGFVTNRTYVAHDGAGILAWSQSPTSLGQLANVGEGDGKLSYGYDDAGRLTSATDNRGGQCVVRGYGFNVSSDRTSKTSTTHATTDCASTVSSTSTWNNEFDNADRQTHTSITGNQAGTGTYTYDQLGRTTSLPAVDTHGGKTVSLKYYSDDSVWTQTAGTTTREWTRDPLGRENSWRDITGGTPGAYTVNHYDSGEDSPSWTARPDGWDRYLSGPGGLSLTATGSSGNSDATSVEMSLTNPHGDVVSTIADTANINADQLGAINTTDEYGVTADPTPPQYGWEGAAQRSRNTVDSNLILMGARQYNPNSGRFLTTDPVAGGNANTYTYPTDPINGDDLNGEYSGSEIAACVQVGAFACNNARNITNYVTKHIKGNSNKVNARRHFIWNFMLMAQIGRGNTVIITNGHEGSQSNLDSVRDRLNNDLVQRTQYSNSQHVGNLSKWNLNRLFSVADKNFKQAWNGKQSRHSFYCVKKKKVRHC